MKKFLSTLYLVLALTFASAQTPDQFKVVSKTLNMRLGPGPENEVVFELTEGDLVALIEKTDNGWWLVDYDGTQGYVFSKLLKKDKHPDWIRKKLESGESPECDNYDKQYDNNIDNYLRIKVGGHTNVVVKLMQRRPEGDICIRMAFVRKNESTEIKNIPEGDYYLKIAYGSDWRQKIINNQCVGKFLDDPHYEIGKEQLRYNIIHQTDRDQIPSYELFLDMITIRSKNKKFNVNAITEAEFNK